MFSSTDGLYIFDEIHDICDTYTKTYPDATCTLRTPYWATCWVWSGSTSALEEDTDTARIHDSDVTVLYNFLK